MHSVDLSNLSSWDGMDSAYPLDEVDADQKPPLTLGLGADEATLESKAVVTTNTPKRVVPMDIDTPSKRPRSRAPDTPASSPFLRMDRVIPTSGVGKRTRGVRASFGARVLKNIDPRQPTIKALVVKNELNKAIARDGKHLDTPDNVTAQQDIRNESDSTGKAVDSKDSDESI